MPILFNFLEKGALCLHCQQPGGLEKEARYQGYMLVRCTYCSHHFPAWNWTEVQNSIHSLSSWKGRTDEAWLHWAGKAAMVDWLWNSPVLSLGDLIAHCPPELQEECVYEYQEELKWLGHQEREEIEDETTESSSTGPDGTWIG